MHFAQARPDEFTYLRVIISTASVILLRSFSWELLYRKSRHFEPLQTAKLLAWSSAPNEVRFVFVALPARRALRRHLR